MQNDIINNNINNAGIAPASHLMNINPYNLRLTDSVTGLIGTRWEWGTTQMAESTSLRKRLHDGLRVKYVMCVRVLYYHRCARDQAQNIYKSGYHVSSASGFERMMFVSTISLLSVMDSF